MAIDEDETNRLLGEVVGRIPTGRGDELEVRVRVLAKTLGPILRLAPVLLAVLIEQARRLLDAEVDNLCLDLLEGGPEFFRGEALVPRDDLEYPFDGVEQRLAVGAGGRLG